MDMKTKSAQQTNGTLLRTICLILSMVMLLFAATGCDDSNEDKVYSRTCRVCGKRIRIEQVNMATLHTKTAKAFSGQICV